MFVFVVRRFCFCFCSRACFCFPRVFPSLFCKFLVALGNVIASFGAFNLTKMIFWGDVFLGIWQWVKNTGYLKKPIDKRKNAPLHLWLPFGFSF